MNHSFVNVFIILLTYTREWAAANFCGLGIHVLKGIFSVSPCISAVLLPFWCLHFEEIIISRCSRDHIPEICMIKWNETVIMIMIRKKERENEMKEWEVVVMCQHNWESNILRKKISLVFFNLYLWEISIAVYVHFYMF